ncbi:MAG: UDP-glucose 6-dehydrogenase, partial [Peptostreptococcaceae bacterium]
YIMNNLKEKGIEVVVYEPTLTDDYYLDFKIIKGLEDLKLQCDIIISNRISNELLDVVDKVYTRDLYNRD